MLRCLAPESNVLTLASQYVECHLGHEQILILLTPPHFWGASGQAGLGFGLFVGQ